MTTREMRALARRHWKVVAIALGILLGVITLRFPVFEPLGEALIDAVATEVHLTDEE